MSQKHTYFKWGIAIIGVIILGVVFFRFKDYILPVLAGIGGVIGYLFGKKLAKDPISPADRKKEQEVYQQINDVKQQTVATDQKQQDLDQRIDDLEKQVKKRRQGGSGTPIILLVALFLLAGTAWAAKGDRYIPTDYNELKKLYIEADKQVLDALDIINEQRQQIADLQEQRDEVLQSADTLREVYQNKDKIIADQSARLEHFSHQWGLAPGYQTSQGFTLGLTRRIDLFFLGVGVVL